MTKVMLVAGEASGDLHGANLARAILEREPGARLFGMGGELMREAGVRLLFNPTSVSAVGFVEVLRNVQLLRRVLARLAEVVERQAPDAVVLIDFPEFNMRLAEMIKGRGIPLIYYFSPSAWAWRKGRARTVAAQKAIVCAVHPYEEEVYREAGADVRFVGHPLIDVARPSLSREEARQAFGCADGDPVIALLPGSRKQEMDNHLAPMIGAAKRILEERPGAVFLMGVAHTISIEKVRAKIPPELPIRLIEGRSYDVLHAADAGAAKVGTVCLEAALIGTPIVSLYRMSASSFWIAKRLYTREHVAPPNVIADRKVMVELFQDEVNPERIAREVLALLDPAKREEVAQGYAEVRKRLGGPGAVGRAAEVVLEAARAKEGGAHR